MWTQIGEEGVHRPSLENDEMAHLLSFIYFISYSDSPGNQVRGRKVFEEKNCVLCHATGGGKKLAGPDLAASQDLLNSYGLLSAMWNHAPTMQQAMEGQGLEFPQFEKDEMRDLSAYLRSVATSR